MSHWVFKLRSGHEEVFGDDRPRSYHFIIMKLFDFWEMHPLRPELTTMYQNRPEEEKLRFKEKYVEEVKFKGMTGIAPAFHFEPGVHRSWQLINYLKRDGEIKVPCCVWFGKEKNGRGYVYEGHHRVGAAELVGWETIPALVLDLCGAIPGPQSMPIKDKEEFRQEQMKRGLPDSTRIHGRKIHEWSEKELRTFMIPRPHNKSKYYMQSLFTSECAMGHPDWEGIPVGSIVIDIRAGKFVLPWEKGEEE